MATLNSWALTTVADVKETLGIDAGDSSKNNLIIRKINQATDMIEGWCGLAVDHHFKSQTYTEEEYDSNSSNQLVFLQRPVTAITSFQVRNTFDNTNSWDDIDSSLYFNNVPNNSGILELGFGQSGGYNHYRVTYTAGYTTIPSDLAEACVILAGYLVENAATGTAVKKKQEGARSIEYFDTQGSGSLVESLGLDDMLSRYKNYVLV